MKRYMRKAELLKEVVPFGATKFWQLVKDGSIPGPAAYLSPTMPVWDTLEVSAALERLVAKAAVRSVPDASAEARRVGSVRRSIRSVLAPV
jgi:hypothetical protein